MAEYAMVIAVGGPTGLMLAGELALAGVDVAVVERRANQDLTGQTRWIRRPGRVRYRCRIARQSYDLVRVAVT